MMANDIKTTLTDRMAASESFSISLDESTDLSDKAQLAIFLRGVDKEFIVTEKLLALQTFKGMTTGDDIFNEVQRVFTDGIADFIQIKNKPLSELNDPKWIYDLALLVDLTGYSIDLNFELQKQGQSVNDLYSHLKGFQNKIRLWEAQMLSGNSYHFTTLSAYENISYAQYAEEFKLLSEQFPNTFRDFKNVEDCFNLFATSTKSNAQNALIHLQMELIEIKENSLLKSKFEDVE
ncbi:General transcription factor II-I repeat domain-containing protein 2A [Eumeta japonica]|uniref:General transcription factor II-I repeat domain-containing protein 2A n=1 Tax=Eumeta variegata TaxID=151549 RepID=A0A4C1SXH8_EUMVA|nr:General transcription factor II-I repeat domain-containing protein 2A [Eumeta japonica]